MARLLPGLSASDINSQVSGRDNVGCELCSQSCKGLRSHLNQKSCHSICGLDLIYPVFGVNY